MGFDSSVVEADKEVEVGVESGVSVGILSFRLGIFEGTILF